MHAPGHPGIPPTWASSEKDLVTTSMGCARVWVTLGYGIVNEIYHPSTGDPQVRDLGFIVADEEEWFELKRVNRYTLSQPEPCVPLPTVTHCGDRYELTLEILPDPDRDTLLIRWSLDGDGFRLYPLLAPHLGFESERNTAWIEGGDAFARGGDQHLCLRSDRGFRRTSVGFVGASDGWQDFTQNGRMTWTYDRAEEGNVAIMAECEGDEGVLSLGFSRSVHGARTRARSSLAGGFDRTRDCFISAWSEWATAVDPPARSAEVRREAKLSATVLKVHEDKSYPGAVTASLSIPWGNTRNDLGGYHLVWTRDMVEVGLGLVAAGLHDDARRMLVYLVSTQRDDGCWTQNFYPDGEPYWDGIQLDEVGFPILLAAKLAERGDAGVQGVRRMVHRAISYLVRHGPITPLDRWEEVGGASPFTLAVEIAALVAGAPFLDAPQQKYVLSLADSWNERVESWTYAENGEWASGTDVDGYYVRVAPSIADGLRGRRDLGGTSEMADGADAVVSMDFMYLARLGLRRPGQRWMRNTLAVADSLLRQETPSGPGFHRYNGDRYGEYDDGRPYDGGGEGRIWPLLTGERGHYALQSGDDPTPYLETMIRMTGRSGLIPEQVWDSEPIPDKNLWPGKPSGSAMPLVWAHAEFLKLVYAADEGRPIELLDVVWDRYGGERPRAPTWHWRSETPFDVIPPGRDLLIEGDAPFTVRLEVDGWDETRARSSKPLSLRMHGVRVESASLEGCSTIVFSLHGSFGDGGRHTVVIASDD